jgi:ankyrin repeat protein
VTFDQVHRSIKQDNAIDFRKALDAGLNSNLTNRFGWSLLMLVAIQGNLSIRQELVTRGTKIECVNQFAETLNAPPERVVLETRLHPPTA